jgi:hypothetical protein
MNAIFTTYFTSEKDPQRPFIWANDDFSIIKNFYNSVVKYNLHCFIFYDNCSDEFVQKYQTDKIKFVKYDARNKNMVDERWSLYYTYLKHNENIKKLLCLDISDVVILKNPFNFMSNDTVYVGDEECLNRQNRWMLDRYEMIGFDIRNIFDKKVLNCGILGASREHMLDITKKIGDIITENNVMHTTIDMAAANAVIYSAYSNKLVHGQPWNTKYRGGAYPFSGKDNMADTCYIQHK